MKLLREPLVHFLAIGVGLFVLFELAANEDETPDDKVIVVDREALLTFVQYRSKAFEPLVAARRLDALSDTELERLIADYVREEALHREALALGMDEHDYVIKQRLIQKVEFINEGLATATLEVSDEDVEAYFTANAADYRVEPHVTFTHVFFASDRRGRDAARSLAEAKLSELNDVRVPFVDSPKHGDRFLYHTNYVERVPDFVSSHFGATMGSALFELEPDAATWRGPFESAYGFHLVLLPESVPGRTPDLADVADRVRADAKRALVRERSDTAISDIVATYDVRLDYERGTATEALASSPGSD